jgi:hypothetical protein
VAQCAGNRSEESRSLPPRCRKGERFRQCLRAK